jgi:phosphate:Na+ symporter
MLTLLNLLSAVALLVWGTHIVRTGILRVRFEPAPRHQPEHGQAAAGVHRRHLVTAMVQSSNATAMLVTSFVGQGLMAMTPAWRSCSAPTWVPR